MPALASTWRTLALLAAGLALLACDVPEYSDGGRYLLSTTLARPLGTRSRTVLVDSRFEVKLLGIQHIYGEVDPQQGGLACASLGASGSLSVSGDEFVVEAAGPGAVEIGDPDLNCPANTDGLSGLGSDRWSFEAVGPELVSGRWANYGDASARFFDTSAGPRGEFPPEFGGPLEAPLRVAAGGRFTVMPALVESANEAEVRWGDPDHLLVVPERYDQLRPSRTNDAGEVLRDELLAGELQLGAAFDAELDVLGTRFELPRVESVGVDTITRMDLVAIYYSGDETREWGPPAGVVAMTYDDLGNRVVGAPVEFSVSRGRLALVAADYEEGDARGLADICQSPPRELSPRSATIEASLGALRTSVDLEWTASPDDTNALPYPAECEGTDCDCRSVDPEDTSVPGLALLALLGLGFGRHRSRRKAASTLAR